VAQNMLFPFANISAEILLLVLGYSFYPRCIIVSHFLPNAVAIKSGNISCAKADLH
jgi:hypothetical protein